MTTQEFITILDQKLKPINDRLKRLEDNQKNFITKDDLKDFATKDDLKGFATKDDLKGFATKDDIQELKRDIKAIRRDMATKKSVRTVSKQVDFLFTALDRDVSENRRRIITLEKTAKISYDPFSDVIS